jgi:Eukaryotic initiation factor 4E
MSNELSSSWVFWYSSISKRYGKENLNREYEKELVLLCEVQTLQQFFNAYCHLQKVSEIGRFDSLSFFRYGRKPMWESCLSGGCWIIKVSRKDLIKADFYWETFLIECVRGGFSEDIDGIVATAKPYEISIQVWMHEAAAAKLKVAEEIKSALKVAKLDMYLKYHKDSVKDLSTFKNSVLIEC